MTNLRAILAHNMKARRQVLGISQAGLAEKVSTSTHYIGQIELKNKFPSPEMLERIAAALEIDSPELFFKPPFQSDLFRHFQKGVLSELEKLVSELVTEHIQRLDREDLEQNTPNKVP
jgi:transcriptional regulator with XRE-family HTH domain